MCQEFQNRIFRADRLGFEEATGWLRRTVPAPGSIQEADWLKTILKDGVVSSGISFHRWYHQQDLNLRCTESPVEAVHRLWAHHDDDPRVTLERWVSEFLRVFDRAHPMSLAQRAAAVLRARFRNPPGLAELARMLGTSRSVLARALRHELALTRSEYVARVRLRHFISRAFEGQAPLGRLAEQCGYRRYHNLLDALKQRTGLTPRSVQLLARTEIDDLLHTHFNISAPIQSRQAEGRQATAAGRMRASGTVTRLP